MEDKIKDKKKDELLLEAIRSMAITGENTELIGLDDSFGFHCKQCGCCCMNRKDIILNPFDIYNGAKYLKMPVQEFLGEYTSVSIGPNSRLPIILLKPKEDTGWCPLLEYSIKDGGIFKCKINPSKPGACANHPIGVVRNIDITTKEENLRFIKVSQCENSKSDEQHTVREWLGKYLDNLEEVSAAHTMQTLFTQYTKPTIIRDITVSTMMIMENEEFSHIGDDLKEELKDKFSSLATIVVRCYMEDIRRVYDDYDISLPFLPQAKNHISVNGIHFSKVKNEYDEYDNMIKSISGYTIDELVKKHKENEEEDNG